MAKHVRLIIELHRARVWSYLHYVTCQEERKLAECWKLAFDEGYIKALADMDDAQSRETQKAAT